MYAERGQESKKMEQKKLFYDIFQNWLYAFIIRRKLCAKFRYLLRIIGTICIYIRHHTDLLSETVCYAVRKE